MANASGSTISEPTNTHQMVNNNNSRIPPFSDTFTWVWTKKELSNDRALIRSTNRYHADRCLFSYTIDWNSAPTGVFQPLPTLLRIITVLRSNRYFVGTLLQFSILLYDCSYLNSHPDAFNVHWDLISSWHDLMQAVPGLTLDDLTQFRVEADRVVEYLEGAPTVVEWFQSKLRIRKWDAYVLASITVDSYDEIGECRRWLNEQLTKQPLYIDLPSDFRPSSFDAWDHTTPYLGPLLHQLLADFLDKPNTIYRLLLTVCKIGNAVVRYHGGTDWELFESWLDFQDCMVEEFSKNISNPISDTGSLLVRKASTQINIRGLTEFFAHVKTELWLDVSNNHLGWMMHRSILQCAASSAEGAGYQQSVLDGIEGWIQLLNSDEPVADWNPFPDYFSWVIDGPAENEDDIPDNLSVVSFEPAGEDHDVNSFATQVHIDKEGSSCLICHFDLTDTADDGSPMKLNVCSHIFHHHCLGRHINGVESWSTTCPHCREVICKPRERHPKYR